MAGAGLTAVALVSAAATGALVVGLYRSDAAPEVLSPARTLTSVAVTQADFDDARTVTLTVDRDEATEVVSPVAGKVTASACRPGTPLLSGQSGLSVDGIATISLATSVPLWRDLAVGDSGADVTALQQELTRLGRTVAVTGTMNRATVSALSALLTEAQGSRITLTTVPAARVMWLPQASTEVGACNLSIGGLVAAGDVVATVPGSLRSVSLLEVPAALVPGPRTLVVDGTSVPVDPSTPITDAAVLAELVTLPAMRPTTVEQADAPSGRLKLTDSVHVSVIPPSAVLLDNDDTALGCVIGDGSSMAVRVVGSQLGQTYVVFDAAAPAQVEVQPASGLTCR